ncbi:TPA: class I SAM-dependent methyltransferase [Candidatus Nomurabacteria bacterium]|nr:MAG: Alternative oxidase/tellurite resistance protein TehB [Parcubacteria bacterium RAAC4_OD1_1]HCY26543.1 class I SAM-dependent methyltransferase [Candidatus Nomurabacteria bacterium]
MSHQGNIWDREYNNPKFVTKNDGPQADTLRFLKFLKKEKKVKLENLNILDLGCGTGRNSNYLSGLGNSVIGIEISKTALNLAKTRSVQTQFGRVEYILGDIGEPYNVDDNWADVILDVTSSNSLNEKGREVYLSEMNRVLKKGGYIFVRALCKDGNKNVKNLLKNNPGKEYDTYVIKEIGLTERVFSREDFIKTYSRYFKILKLEKKTNYTTFNDRIYKRDYFIAYIQK